MNPDKTEKVMTSLASKNLNTNDVLLKTDIQMMSMSIDTIDKLNEKIDKLEADRYKETLTNQGSNKIPVLPKTLS